MSRGRGGFGGGRGGRGGKLGGSDVPWAYDPDVKPDYKPSELFPEVRQPAPGLITARERSQVARYRDSNSRVTQPGGAPAKVMIDPFEGMPTYTQKYRKKTRKVPRLDTRPYVLRFFPQELWSTLDPDRAMQEADDQPHAMLKRKTLKIGISSQQTSALHRLSGNDDPMQTDEHNTLNHPPGAVIKTELDHNEEDEDEAGAGRTGVLPEDELLDGLEEEEIDDDYESGEDEMAGDYMAEGYFDDGADDLGGDDYDGGGDGGDEGPLM